MGQRGVESRRGQEWRWRGGGEWGVLPVSLTPVQVLSSYHSVDGFTIQDLIARTSRLRNIYIVLPQDFYHHHQKHLFHPWLFPLLSSPIDCYPLNEFLWPNAYIGGALVSVVYLFFFPCKFEPHIYQIKIITNFKT